jgi:2-haloacid dehalogenase/putative hydrolase of the HAD superfamily
LAQIGKKKTMKLSEFKVLAFDVYGTLIDWESGMVTGLKPLTDKLSRDLTRDEILEAHAYYESSTQRWTPAKKYSDLLGVVYRRLAEEWGVEVSWEECQAYGLSVRQWPAFEDSRGALAYLKQHFKLVVLTNTDNVSFSGSNARLGVHFDGVYTAEDIGSYKPADRNFDYMLEALTRQGIQKSEILHTAESMFHDHAPANKHGLTNCWIYRRHGKTGFGATMNPIELPHYDYRFDSMADLVKAHRAELAQD